MHRPTFTEALAILGVIAGVLAYILIGAALAPLSTQR